MSLKITRKYLGINIWIKLLCQDMWISVVALAETINVLIQ